MLRQELEEVTNVIYKNAAATPYDINFEDAETSMTFVGDRYLHLWLDAYQKKLIQMPDFE